MNYQDRTRHPAAPKQVGVRDFRTNLTSYLEGGEPLEIVNKGRTLGYFKPVLQLKTPTHEDMARMRKALEESAALAEELGITDEEIDAALKAVREADDV